MADAFVPVGTAATLIYTPASSSDRLRVANSGNSTIFLGQAGVTAALGLPLKAGTKPIELTALQGAVYAVCGSVTTGAPSGTTNAAIAAGAVALPVASGGASFTQGMVVQVDTGKATETLTVGAGSTGTSIVVSATQYAHASGVAIVTLTGAAGGSVHVSSGTG
jgi:hypothetical protein